MGRRLDEDTLATFHDSLDRVLQRSDFFDLFYDRLLASSPEIARKFDGVDLRRVKRHVRDSFYLKMMASDGNRGATARLEKLAEQHAAIHVTRAMHDQWTSVMLTLVEELDPGCDAEVAQSWREVLRIGTDIMKARAPA
ncbi:MAG: globin domain-containing protein [Candidatus Binatia bacterium]